MATWEQRESGKFASEHHSVESEGSSVDGFTVQHHTSSADTPTSSGGGDTYPRQANPMESHHAQSGQMWSTLGHAAPGPFMPSNGMYSNGHDHVAAFSRSIRMAGGVRQGPSYTSDPASGVGRGDVGGSAKLDVQKQGSGDTFRDRQHRRWAGRGG